MAIPDFQSLMLPLLKFASDGREHSLAEAREHLAEVFRLSDEDRREFLPSGRQRRFDNRVAWAKVYLSQALLLDSPRRAHFVITDRGRSLLKEVPEKITISFLERYDDFRAFRGGTRNQNGTTESTENQEEAVATPEETLETAYLKIRNELASELLDRIKASAPSFFETLVVELLLKMGYGGSRSEAGETIGRTGDEGIDGIISEDRLGLDLIYIQAKRWEGTVGRPEIQKFVGALHGKRARKGVFITTGVFSTEAYEYVAHIDPRVVLIDGSSLSEYMIDFGLGVTTRQIYEIKRIDSDYFVEE